MVVDDPYTIEREGFLTQADREYLISGPKEEWSETTEKTKRHRIRKRAKGGIQDLALLLHELDRVEDRKAIQEVDVKDAIAFLVQKAVRDMPSPVRGRDGELTVGAHEIMLDSLLSFGVERAAKAESLDWIDSVMTAVKVDFRGRKNGFDLERDLQSGEITAEDIETYYREGLIESELFYDLTRGLDLLHAETEEEYQAILDESPFSIQNQDDDPDDSE